MKKLKCNSCHKESDDIIETQEWLTYSDTGGYGNIIAGDMFRWSVTLCQECTCARLGDVIVVEYD